MEKQQDGAMGIMDRYILHYERFVKTLIVLLIAAAIYSYFA